MTSSNGALRVSDAVILTGDARKAAAWAVNFARERLIQERRQQSHQLDVLAALLSDCPQADNPTGAPEETGEGKSAGLLSTEEVANRLNVSSRTVRRLAPKLDGHLLGGTWMIPEAAVEEHQLGGVT